MLIQGGAGIYLENTAPSVCDDAMISDKGFDGTVLHYCLLCRFNLSTRWFPIWMISSVAWGGLVDVWESMVFKSLVPCNLLILLCFRLPTSFEIIQNGLSACFHIVRSICFAMKPSSNPKGGPGGCREYVPEMRCFKYLDGGLISDKGLDGTVLRVLLVLVQLFNVVVPNSDGSLCSMGEFCRFP